MTQEFTPKPDSADKLYPEAESSSEQMGKVAEAVATYAVRTVPKWRPPALTIAGVVTDDEAWAFVKANNLWPYLEMAIRLVREKFVDVREIKLSYEPDQEIPRFNCIAINVKAGGTVDELFEQDKKYIRAFVQAVPPERRHQITLFLSVVA
jgi:hypothetical protein